MRQQAAVWAFVVLGCGAVGAGQVMPVQGRLPNGQTVGIGPVSQGEPSQERQQTARGCEEQIAAADKALSEGKWYTAWEALKQASALASEESQRQRITDLLGKLEGAGRAMLTEADRAYSAQQYAQALGQYTEVSRRFGGVPCVADARKALKTMESDPAAQEVLQDAKAQELDKLVTAALSRPLASPRGAASQPASAAAAASQPAERAKIIKTLPPEQADSVVSLLERIVKTYPLCPTARRAQADLRQLQEDPEFQASLQGFRDRRKANGLLQRARAYASAGLYDKALEDYRQVLRLYPHTPEAKTAQQALASGGRAGGQ